MSVLVTQDAPDFISTAVLADGQIVEDFQLSSFKGKKIVLFFYPLDFTFVCPTEILAHHHRIAAFDKLDTQLIGVSIDSRHTHNAWRNTKINDGGIGFIDFPLVSDMDHKIMEKYGIVHPEGAALRASFLIDADFVVRHQVVNDHPLGRNVDEMLRMVDALDFHTENEEVCPAGWNRGDEGMKESAESVEEYLSKIFANL